MPDVALDVAAVPGVPHLEAALAAMSARKKAGSADEVRAMPATLRNARIARCVRPS